MSKLPQQTGMWLFLVTGLLVQLITFCLIPHSPWAMISGVFGICSVVLSAQGNILTFVFGSVQVAGI